MKKRSRSLKIKLTPFLFGGTKIGIDGTDYYVKMKDYETQQELYGDLNSWKKEIKNSEILKKGGVMNISSR